MTAHGRQVGGEKGAPARGREPAGLKARRTALEILLRVEREGAFADLLLGHRLRSLGEADRRLVTRLVLGTLAWKLRLDAELARLCRRPLEALDPELLALLRLGLFQLRFLDRVPAHAAVDSAVELAARGGHRHSRGLVNAVLRRAAREGFVPAAKGSDAMGRLAVAYSHPRWLVEKFVAWFGGADAEAVMAANNEAAPTVARLNLRRGQAAELIAMLDAQGLKPSSTGRLPESCVVQGPGLLDSQGYRLGLYSVQSEASQLVARMLAPEPGALVVDGAAAPGAKATHLAEIVGERGRVVALDSRLSGLKQLVRQALRLGHANVLAVCADLGAGAPLEPGCSRYVLLDAPCTGLGTLREHPEIRWRLGPEDAARMAELQGRLLHAAASLVASGGVLVYAVCSLAPEEGVQVVRAFLDGNRRFRAAPPAQPVFAPWLNSDGFMLTRPDRGGLDGFFAARLERTGPVH